MDYPLEISPARCYRIVRLEEDCLTERRESLTGTPKERTKKQNPQKREKKKMEKEKKKKREKRKIQGKKGKGIGCAVCTLSPLSFFPAFLFTCPGLDVAFSCIFVLFSSPLVLSGISAPPPGCKSGTQFAPTIFAWSIPE